MTKTLLAISLLALTLAPAQNNSSFLGVWNMTGTGTDSGVVYWLDVKEEGGVIKGRFLNRANSPYDLPNIKNENGELSFWNAPPANNPQAAPNPVWRAKVVDGKLVG